MQGPYRPRASRASSSAFAPLGRKGLILPRRERSRLVKSLTSEANSMRKPSSAYSFSQTNGVQSAIAEASMDWPIGVSL